MFVPPLGRKYGLNWNTVVQSLSRAVEMLEVKDRSRLRVTLLIPAAKVWEPKEAERVLKSAGKACGPESEFPVTEHHGAHWQGKRSSLSQAASTFARVCQSRDPLEPSDQLFVDQYQYTFTSKNHYA